MTSSNVTMWKDLMIYISEDLKTIIIYNTIWPLHKNTHHHKITAYGVFNPELLKIKSESSYNNHYFQFYVVKWFYTKN